MKIGAFIALSVILCACGKKEISREQAKEIIQMPSTQEVLALTPEQVNGLVQGGYLAWNGVGAGLLVVTPLGRRWFANANGVSMFSGPPMGTLNVVTATPIKRKVLEVTGITIDGDTRRVQYNWQLDFTSDFPPVAVSTNPVRGATAVFRPYDDGWRMEKAQ